MTGSASTPTSASAAKTALNRLVAGVALRRAASSPRHRIAMRPRRAVGSDMKTAPHSQSCPSLDANLGVLDDLFVFRHLVADVAGELLPAQLHRIEAQSVQTRLDVRQRQYLGNIPLQLVGHIGR